MALGITETRAPRGRQTQKLAVTGNDDPSAPRITEQTRVQVREAQRRQRTAVSVNGLGDPVMVVEGVD